MAVGAGAVLCIVARGGSKGGEGCMKRECGMAEMGVWRMLLLPERMALMECVLIKPDALVVSVCQSAEQAVAFAKRWTI